MAKEDSKLTNGEGEAMFAALCRNAGHSDNGVEAMQWSQAAANLAGALRTMRDTRNGA